MQIHGSFLRVLFLAGLVVAGALLEQLGAAQFLWAFPLSYPGLALWLFFVSADLLLLQLRWGAYELARLLLWSAGLVFFAARSGFPLTGLCLVLFPAVLWVLSRGETRKLLRFAVPVLGLIFVLGHDARYAHWSIAGQPLGWRFSFHLVAVFLFFRSCSWLVVVAGRGERPGFLRTMEYFLAPAFWLSPLHTNHLVWEHASAKDAQLDSGLGAAPDYAQGVKPDTGQDYLPFLWILRGLLHSLILSLFGSPLIAWLGVIYSGGVHAVAWYEWLALGPVLFMIAYLDKSQVSYLTAGYLRLAGWEIEPDFRAPWLAKDLLDYWRRFHYWLWEFYMNVIYTPLLVVLGRRLAPERALPLALFLAFTLGTGLGHFLSYRAGLGMSMALGLLFGAATMVHYYLRQVFARARIGIPVTWLTVFLLYILAYPIFGLGWGPAEFRQFWR